MSPSKLSVACLFLMMSAPGISASVVFYTNQSLYNSAVATAGLSNSTFNFNSTPVQSYSNAAGLTIDGVNFVSPNGNGGYYLGTAPSNYCCNDYTDPNESLQAAAKTSSYYNISNGYTIITLPAGATTFSLTAFTLQAGDYTNSGHDTLNLNVNGSVGQTATTAGSGTGFIGFISTAPVASLILTGTTAEDFIDIINGSVGSPVSNSSAPEPSSWAMICAAATLTAGVRYRNGLSAWPRLRGLLARQQG